MKETPETSRDSDESPYPRYYGAVIAGGICTGLIVGFILGTSGTILGLKLVMTPGQWEFFYGGAYVIFGGGLMGAIIGGIIGGWVGHRLAISRFYKYSHYILGITFLLAVSVIVGFTQLP